MQQSQINANIQECQTNTLPEYWQLSPQQKLRQQNAYTVQHNNDWIFSLDTTFANPAVGNT